MSSLSWEYHASRHVPKHALKYDIFWTSLRHRQLCLTWGTLDENISNQRLGKGWQKVGQKVIQIVGPTTAHCRPNIGDIGLPDKTTLGQHFVLTSAWLWRWRRPNVGLTLALTSAQHRLDYIMLSGKGMKLQSDLCTTATRKEGEMWQLEAGCHLNGIIHYTLYIIFHL